MGIMKPNRRDTRATLVKAADRESAKQKSMGPLAFRSQHLAAIGYNIQKFTESANCGRVTASQARRRPGPISPPVRQRKPLGPKDKKVEDTSKKADLAKDAKIIKGKFDPDTKKAVDGDAIEKGLENELFSNEKGVVATITTDDDGKVTKIRVQGKKKATN
jgi:hypothetical protein